MCTSFKISFLCFMCFFFLVGCAPRINTSLYKNNTNSGEMSLISSRVLIDNNINLKKYGDLSLNIVDVRNNISVKSVAIEDYNKIVSFYLPPGEYAILELVSQINTNTFERSSKENRFRIFYEFSVKDPGKNQFLGNIIISSANNRLVIKVDNNLNGN